MSIRKKPARNRSRRDPTKPVFPPIAGVTASINGTNVDIVCDIPIVLNGDTLSGITVAHSGVEHEVTAGVQTDQFTVTLTFGTYHPVTGDVLNISAQMTGIRTIRGGMVALSDFTF